MDINSTNPEEVQCLLKNNVIVVVVVGLLIGSRSGDASKLHGKMTR